MWSSWVHPVRVKRMLGYKHVYLIVPTLTYNNHLILVYFKEFFNDLIFSLFLTPFCPTYSPNFQVFKVSFFAHCSSSRGYYDCVTFVPVVTMNVGNFLEPPFQTCLVELKGVYRLSYQIFYSNCKLLEFFINCCVK